jgi:cation diffusion facilitator CzcD-associated flavoprotein CzcO
MGSLANKTYDTIVIGAGFGGLHLTHELRKAGFTVKLIEAGSGPGGI